MNNKGVTLVELLISIVVMGIIAAFSTVAVNAVVDNVRQDGFVENGETFMAQAKQAYFLGSDIWDDDQVTLQELVDGKFVEPITKDPWGTAYDMEGTLFTIEEVDAATPNSIFIPRITLDSNGYYSSQNIIFEGVVISDTATMGLREGGPLREFNKSDIDFVDGSTNIIKEAVDAITGNDGNDNDGTNNDNTDNNNNDDNNNDNTDNNNNDNSNNDDNNNDNSNNADNGNNDEESSNGNEDNEDDGNIIDDIIDAIFGDDEDDDTEEETDYTSGNDTRVYGDDVTSSESIYALDGNDTITINGKVKSNAVVDLGTGNDSVTINDKVEKASISTGDGNDTVNINDEFKNDASLTTGDGNDTVNIDEIKNNASLSTGNGNDVIFIRDISSSFKGSITLGNGNDYFRSNENKFNGVKGTIDGGSGNDTLILLNVSEKDWNKTVSKYFTGFEKIELKDTTLYN